MLRGIPALLCSVLMSVSTSAAQDKSDVDALFPQTQADSLDPIGTGQLESLRRVDTTRPVTIVAGESLIAPRSLRETRHRTLLTIGVAFTQVSSKLHLKNSGKRTGSFAYRLPIPVGARIGKILLCHGEACANDSSLYVTYQVGDGILTVMGANLPPKATTTLHIRYVVANQQLGGVTRFTLPGRFGDMRVSDTRSRVELTPDAQKYFNGIELDGYPYERPLVFPATHPLQVTASVKEAAKRTLTYRYTCQGKQCAWLHRSSGSKKTKTTSFGLLIDTSPSMSGVAANRSESIANTLLKSATNARGVAAFATKAKVLREYGERIPADDHPFSLPSALYDDLGRTTRLHNTLAILKRWKRRGMHRVILISDGTMTDGRKLRRNLAKELKSLNLTLDVVNVSDRVCANGNEARCRELTILAKQSNGTFLDYSKNADSQFSEGEQLASLFSPPAFPKQQRRGVGSLPYGELQARELELQSKKVKGTRLPQIFAAWSQGNTDPEVPSQALLSPILKKLTKPVSAAVATKQAITNVPKETVLTMLRTRIVPAARRCFRRDRAGRTNYSVRVAFRFELADREVLSSAISGKITPKLRSCLDGTLDTLIVPHFEGKVVVNYPVHTEAQLPQPRIEFRHQSTGKIIEEITRGVPTEPSL